MMLTTYDCSPTAAMLVQLANSSGKSVWSDAARDAINHILLVLANNPRVDLAEIFARPDVQEALIEAGANGAVAVIDELKSIWVGNGGSSASPYLAKLIEDARRNGQLYPARTQRSLVDLGRDSARSVLYADRIRAAAATAVADTRSIAEASFASLYDAGFRKVKWQANYKNGHLPCKWCRYLHNQVVNIGDSFTDDPSIARLNIYGDLTRPPRHPNCQCRLVGVK